MLGISCSLATDPLGGTIQRFDLAKQRDKYQRRLVRANAIKIFADGVIESMTVRIVANGAFRGGS